MSSSTLQELSRRVAQQEVRAAQDQLSTAKAKYNRMTLQELGEDKILHGKHQGDPCRQVYQEDPKYVIWILGHQAENVKYLNLVTYAHKVEEDMKKKIPQDDGKAERNSGGEWLQVEPESGPSEPTHSQNSETVVQMCQVLAESITQIRDQMNQIHQSSEQQAQMIYQAMSANVQLQERAEKMDHRLQLLEEALQESINARMSQARP